MHPYIIEISRIEELQILKDSQELENIFTKAKSAIVNGEIVELVRKMRTASVQKYDEISTLEELAHYKKNVFKYI